MYTASARIFEEQRNAVECAFLLNQAVTSADLEEGAMTVLERHLDIDHFSVFSKVPAKPMELLLAGSRMRDGASMAIAQIYAARHHKSDPVPSLDLGSIGAERFFVRRRRAAEVRDIRYRLECYDNPGIAERLTVGWEETGSWMLLHLYRQHQNLSFDDADVEQAVRAAACIVTALSSRNDTPLQSMNDDRRMSWFSDRLRNLQTPLSAREIEVCARALMGMTVERTALDLGVASTSVVTYRRRAYQKLNVASHAQLYTLLL